MDITNSDLTKETMDFAENIEFSENIIPKQEIKEDTEIETNEIYMQNRFASRINGFNL